MLTRSFPVSRRVGQLAAIFAILCLVLSAAPSAASQGGRSETEFGWLDAVERIWEGVVTKLGGLTAIWADQGTLIDPSGVPAPTPLPVLSEQGTMIDPSGLR